MYTIVRREPGGAWWVTGHPDADTHNADIADARECEGGRLRDLALTRRATESPARSHPCPKLWQIGEKSRLL